MSATESSHSEAPTWARAIVSPEAFREEQVRLGRVWTLLGFADDVRGNNDWFRATLGGRSVFVQRFKDELRGFENSCAHRFYPLRTADKGSGPVRCGFHHWQYNKDGLAVGVPKCEELFGTVPRELNARLKPVDIATCGNLVFGRLPNDTYKESLEDYLGPGFDILKAMWSGEGTRYVKDTALAANWRLGHHISLDDYHIVAVHPETFGKAGYIPLESTRYFRFGRHSAYLWGADAEAVERTARECREGSYRPRDYRIFQFFPNPVAVHFEAVGSWYVLLQQYIPLAHDRTLLRSVYRKAPFPPVDATTFGGLVRRLAAPFLPWFIPLYMRKIILEDNEVCERLQLAAHQVHGNPVFGKQEERIIWFEQNYREIVGDLAMLKQE